MSSPPPFLSLQDAVLPAPLPMALALCMAGGVAILGSVLAEKLRGPLTTALDRSAGAVCICGILGLLVHGAIWTGGIPLWCYRGLAWLLAGLGLLQARRIPAGIRAFRSWAPLPEGFRARALVAVTAATALGWFLCALGPTIDPDSLDYHLGAPMHWLSVGAMEPRFDWLHYRLCGLGECLNMLGLAGGTDALGAVLQFGGLAAAIPAIAAGAASLQQRWLAMALVVLSPVVGLLVPTQKFQLLPSAALTVALVIVLLRRRSLDSASVALSAGCVGFALACKHSFFFTACIVSLVTLEAILRTNARLRLLALFAVVVVSLHAPFLARNAAFYGDPVSPFLEKTRSEPDPRVVRFATYLKTYGGGATPARMLRFPIECLVPTRPGELTNALGLGVLAALLVPSVRGALRPLGWLAAAAFLLLLPTCQLLTRYFFEPYLWIAAAACTADMSLRRARFLVVGLCAQGSATAAMALVGASCVHPGAWTPGLRESTMQKYARDYAVASRLDRLLPRDARILSGLRAHALLPRPYVVSTEPSTEAPRPGDEERLERLMKSEGVTVMITSSQEADRPLKAVAARLAEPLGVSILVPTAARNPFNAGREVEFQAWRVLSRTSRDDHD